MRTSAGIKNDFCDAQTHMHKSGGRQPAVATVTRLQRGTVSLGAMIVVIKSGGRQPAVATVTRLQRGTVSLGAMIVVIKSGGRQPAVVGDTNAVR
jgi:hypothetical protein